MELEKCRSKKGRRLIGCQCKRFSALDGSLSISSESSWTPKIQPNDSRAAVWLSFWCSTRPSADTGTITTYYIIIIITALPEHIELLLFSHWAHCAHGVQWYNDDVIGYNQCWCLPKAELNTKNSTRWQQSCRLVEFLVFNSAFGRHQHWLEPITLSLLGGGGWGGNEKSSMCTSSSSW